MSRWLGAAVIGLSAALLMEYVGGFLYRREIDDQPAERLGMVAHYLFGAAGGRVIVALQRTGALR